MKWLIYLLLLLNIGFFAWHFRGGSLASTSSTESLSAGVTRLVLLREQQPEQEKQWCYSLGPLPGPEQADALNQQLHEWKLDSWARKSKEAKRKGYWVLLPPLSTRAEARAMVEQLKAKKISDYFLIATGEKSNGISLGVFSKFESAHRRIKQMNKLGFKPVMEEVKLPAEEYWLDWLRDKGKSLSKDRLARLQQEYADLKQVERSCELPAARAADATDS